MSAVARAFPGLPRTREARLAYFHNRIAAAQAADPLYLFKLAFAWADPDLIRRASAVAFAHGQVVGLSDYHERLRRCYVLRAWLAHRLEWRDQCRAALVAAGTQRRLAAAARREGR